MSRNLVTFLSGRQMLFTQSQALLRGWDKRSGFVLAWRCAGCAPMLGKTVSFVSVDVCDARQGRAWRSTDLADF